MSGKLDIDVRRRDGATSIALAGVLDDDATFDLAGHELSARIVVDMERVERMTEGGALAWTAWLSEMSEGAEQLVLRRCSPAVASRFSAGAPAGAELASFFAPYFCDECDREKVALCDRTNMKVGASDPPVCRCDRCDLVMRFDDDAPTYFGFLVAGQVELATDPLKAGPGELRVHSRRERLRRPSAPLAVAPEPAPLTEETARAIQSATDLAPVAPAQVAERQTWMVVAFAAVVLAAVAIYLITR